VARQFAGRAKVGKVNVHENFELANEYGVNTIPRVFLFHRGPKPLRQVAGLTSEATLVQLLDEALRK
jgi:thioredoxin 1